MEKYNNIIKVIIQILIQYILSIVAIFVLLVNLLNSFSKTNLVIFFVEVLIAFASNCCSISCTMVFVVDRKNDPYIVNKRIIYIIFSIVIYFISNELKKSIIITNYDISEIIFFVFLFIGQIFIACLLTRDYINISLTNENDVKKLNKEDAEKVRDVHKKNIEILDGEKYNLEGEEDVA